ncbi:hypothetical protein [Runella aurantiaca]|uniref:Uncharacterized protein n=1 Tax=Runella aurantiaca TaxID=2282308 RepID=A0A369I225_9BACT|nr:hypothetical protein [Runella aurantiaca]RDB03831.1 hypothetical protein DVG78_21490 [Runella aurantiaca]
MNKICLLSIILLAFKCSPEPEALNAPELKKISITSNDLVLIIEKDSIDIDGKENAEVRIKVNSNLLSSLKEKKVVLKSTGAGKFSNETATIEKDLDLNGEAVDYIKSTEESIVIISAELKDPIMSKTDKVKFYKVEATVITPSIETNDVDADNFTNNVLSLKSVPPSSNKLVHFVAEKGTFISGTNTFSTTMPSTGIVKAYLKHNKPEDVKVVATVGSTYSTEMTVKFKAALPTIAIITSDLKSLPPKLNSVTPVKAQLLRSTGSVSEGQHIVFYDSTTSGARIGTFFNTTTSSTSGIVTAEYSIQDTTKTGFVYIKCYILTPSGRRVLGENRILIK